MAKRKKRQENLNGVVCPLFGMQCRLQNEVISILAILAALVLVILLRQSSFFEASRQGVSLSRPWNIFEKGKTVIMPAVQTGSSENATTKKEKSSANSAYAKDTSSWEVYANEWYGFEIRYPSDWEKPVAQRPARGDKWEQSYIFQKKREPSAATADEQASQSPLAGAFMGFAVRVYSVAAVKELRHTNEFPIRKDIPQSEIMQCEVISGHLVENENFPAEEIHIPPADECYGPVYFFSLTRERYMYNIVPIPKEENQDSQGDKADSSLREVSEKTDLTKNTDPKNEVHRRFPEFPAAVKSFSLTEIKRPPARPPAPRITAPMPVSYKRVNGKLVCAKKNDKPRKSKQGKGKHLDMECCLDPDEYPNPHCTY